jgi:hypothetical protein
MLLGRRELDCHLDSAIAEIGEEVWLAARHSGGPDERWPRPDSTEAAGESDFCGLRCAGRSAPTHGRVALPERGRQRFPN